MSPGQPDDALDEVLRRIERIAEDDDVTVLRVTQRHDLLLENRQPQAVGELVDEDEVADVERGPHRRRGDLERLRHERTEQEDDQQHRKEALRVFDPPGFARVGGATLGQDEPVGERDQSGEHRGEKQEEREVHGRCRRRGRRLARCPARQRVPAAARIVPYRRRAAPPGAAPGVSTASLRRAAFTCRRSAGSPETPPAESRRCRRPSSASCRPSASRAASSCA